MEGAPSAEDIGAAALSAQCYGAGTYRRLDNTFRTIAGTATTLQELVSNAWTDRSRAVGGAYTLGADGFWRFTQFGNTLLAVNKSDTLQESTTGAFADVSGAPKADIVEAVGNFVFLFNTNEATYGDSPDRWWCSAIRDHTDWTPSLATQSATNTLVSTPGPIRAGKKFGDRVVVYKERSMYLGTYVGGSTIWDFQLVVGEAGCGSQEAVVDIGTPDNPVHIFMGADDFWRFDGARPVPLGSPLRKTVYADLDGSYTSRIKTLHDRVNSRVYFFYPSSAGAGAIDKCVVYHYRENRWGRDDRTIEAVFEYLSGGITFDTWDDIAATFDSLTGTSFDSPLFSSGSPKPAVFNASHKIVTLTGATGNSSFTTGDFGDDENYYLLSRVKPVWLTKPTSATMINYYKDNEGDSLTTDQTTTMGTSRFDVLRSARWHRLQFNMVGDNELNTINAQYQQDGEE